MLFGNANNLDRGIFLTQEELDATGSLQSPSKPMAQLLKPQSAVIELHRQRLPSQDTEYETRLPADLTVFLIGPHVLLEPTMGAEKRMHTRSTGPLKVLSYDKNTYTILNLVSKREFRVISSVSCRSTLTSHELTLRKY
jgi:hypothetical protein